MDASSSPSRPEPVLILAGGRATRLEGALIDAPKFLAPIGDACFADIFIDMLVHKGFSSFVFLLGHMSEKIESHLDRVTRPRYPDARFDTSTEPAPRGTGGAIRHAARHLHGRFFLLNGDTFFDFDLLPLIEAHEAVGALLTMVTTHREDASRYGSVQMSSGGRLTGFAEKTEEPTPGPINAGIYLAERRLLSHIPAHGLVSLEHDVIPNLLAERECLACSAQDHEFYDIGTPSSLERFARSWAERKTS